jgi:hypothetical protein
MLSFTPDTNLLALLTTSTTSAAAAQSGSMALSDVMVHSFAAV